MKTLLSLIIFTAMLWSSQVSAQQFDPNVYHRMTTQFRGGGMCLDVFNGGARNNHTHLTGCADLSGQYWLITPAGSGAYRLTTMFRGERMCLDIHNGGNRNNEPHLVPCANFTGQLWRLRWDNGWYRLTTRFRGAGMCLDIHNGGPSNNMPQLRPCANYTGQFWSIQPTDKFR